MKTAGIPGLQQVLMSLTESIGNAAAFLGIVGMRRRRLHCRLALGAEAIAMSTGRLRIIRVAVVVAGCRLMRLVVLSVFGLAQLTIDDRFGHVLGRQRFLGKTGFILRFSAFGCRDILHMVQAKVRFSTREML